MVAGCLRAEPRGAAGPCYRLTPHMSTLTPEKTQEIVTRFGENDKDTGNTRVQVALLTAADQRSDRAPARRTRRTTHSRRGLLMLVGRRRRLPELPAEDRPRRLPRARQGSRPAQVAVPPGMSIIAPGTTAPDFTLQREDGEPFTQRRPRREDRRPRLLPDRLQPRLHRSVPGVPGGARRDHERRRRDLRGLDRRRPHSQTAFREQLGVDDPAALGLRAQGRGRPRARRLLRARRASRTAR